jgi:hypothetical protein
MQRIYQVENAVLRAIKPSQIVLAAIGQVQTSGWTGGILRPWYYLGTPDDGIQDFDFYAEEPPGRSLPVTTPISASITLQRTVDAYWGEDRPLLGIRIHARSNSIEANFDNSQEMAMRPFSEGMPLPWPFPWSPSKTLSDDLRSQAYAETVDIAVAMARARIRGGNTE